MASKARDGAGGAGRFWSQLLRRRVPLLSWLPRYSRGDAVSDVIAGITIGLTLIPQSIAYALLAGLPAQYGLYSSFLGSLVYVFLGTVKEVSIGPTSIMALLTVEYTRDLPLQAAFLLTFLAGAVQLGMALLQLGFLVDLISDPVTSGFTSAYSLMIVVSQLKGLLGLRFKARGFLDTLYKVAANLNSARVADSLLGLGCIVVLLALRKLGTLGRPGSRFRRVLWVVSIGRNALVVLLSAVLSYVLQLNGTAPFELSGKVERGLPPLGLPPFSAPGPDNTTLSFTDMATSIGGGILVVPVVGVLANIAIAKAFSNGATVDASQEMLTLSVCNLLGACVSSMPTCGAFTRSAVSSASGVRSPLSGLYSGALILVALLFLTPYFAFIPKATLSAVLISAVIFLVDLDIVRPLWRNSKRALLTTAVTFLACLGLGVEMGLLLGVITDVAYLVYLWARPEIKVQLCKASCGEYVLVRPDVGLFFPAVDTVRCAVLQAAAREGAGALPVVLDCAAFKGLDYTAVKALRVMVREMGARGQALRFLGLPKDALRLVVGLGVDGFEHCSSARELPALLFGEKLLGADLADLGPRTPAGSALKEESDLQAAAAEAEWGQEPDADGRGLDGQELAELGALRTRAAAGHGDHGR